MSNLSNQMQQRMNNQLTGMRVDQMIGNIKSKMVATGERIEKRPVLEGDNSLEQTRNNDVMVQSRDSSGATIIGAAAGVPGLSNVADAAMTVGEEMASNRNSTFERPQDSIEFTPKQEADIKDSNKQDLQLFNSLDAQLLQLQSFQSCGVTHIRIDTQQNTIFPWEETGTPSHKRKLTPEEEAEMEKTLAFRGTKLKSSSMTL